MVLDGEGRHPVMHFGMTGMIQVSTLVAVPAVRLTSSCKGTNLLGTGGDRGRGRICGLRG